MPMNETESAIPPEARQAADRGDVIAAIRLTREATGLGLKEAKDAVDAYAHGAPSQRVLVEPVQIPLGAVAALYQGNLIEAIRSTRQQTGLGLKASKEAVEDYLSKNPNTQQQFRAAAAARGGGMRRLVGIAALVIVVIVVYLWISGRIPNAP
jgi:ribosomal protein L7/L12